LIDKETLLFSYMVCSLKATVLSILPPNFTTSPLEFPLGMFLLQKSIDLLNLLSASESGTQGKCELFSKKIRNRILIGGFIPIF
jgi:hypothetical protein